MNRIWIHVSEIYSLLRKYSVDQNQPTDMFEKMFFIAAPPLFPVDKQIRLAIATTQLSGPVIYGKRR